MAKPEPILCLTSPIAAHKKTLRGSKRDKRQLTDMQQALYEMALEHAIEPAVRASCARAWSDLQERKRVLEGKPLPGQLRPDLDQKRARKRKPSALIAMPTDGDPPPPAQVAPPTASSPPAVEVQGSGER
jgi:hypothetical protein